MEIFQTFEYNGKVLQLAIYKPESDTQPAAKNPDIKAPGAGQFEIGTINLSTEKLAAGEEFTLSAQVNGKKIAYIYTEILLNDKDLNQSYGPVAREYIQADRNKESSGVSRPDWDDTINIAAKLTPSLRLLTDGVNSAFGFLLPTGYDKSAYQIDGLYTPVDGTAPYRARITFDGAGETTDVIAYKEHGSRATPHALTFKEGDQFTPFVQILTSPPDEKVIKGLSTPLTFHGQPLRWVEEPLMPGDYLVGLLVQDLDGGLSRKYAPLNISK